MQPPPSSPGVPQQPHSEQQHKGLGVREVQGATCGQRLLQGAAMRMWMRHAHDLAAPHAPHALHRMRCAPCAGTLAAPCNWGASANMHATPRQLTMPPRARYVSALCRRSIMRSTDSPRPTLLITSSIFFWACCRDEVNRAAGVATCGQQPAK